MNHRPLGHSGLQVSPLCLGTMMFADRTDEAEAARIVALAREAGVNFIDTADQYSLGGAEAMVGRLIEADRHDWVLASKVGNPMSDKPNETGLGRKWMLRAIDESLGRLGTDHLDIYYLHLDDAETPLEETLSAMADILAAGKGRSRCCRPAATTASAWCPTAPWRAACSPENTSPAPNRMRKPAPAARISASWKASSARNPWRSRKRSRPAPRPRA
jgi:aryl-alcohol dehydrogenase-like predicted oxidoreductase